MGIDKDVAEGSETEPGQRTREQGPARDSEEELGEDIDQNINQGAAEDTGSPVETSVEMSPQRQLAKSSVNLCVHEREGKVEPKMTPHPEESKQHTGGLQSDQNQFTEPLSQNSEGEAFRLLRELAELSQQIVVPDPKQDVSKQQPPTDIVDPFWEANRLDVVSSSNTASPIPFNTRSACHSPSQLPSTSDEKKEDKGTKTAHIKRSGVEAADDQKPGTSQERKPEEDQKPGPSQKRKPEENQKPGPSQKRKPEEDQKRGPSQKRKPEESQKPSPSQKRKPEDKKPGPSQKRKLRPEEAKNFLEAAWSELNRQSMYKIYKVLPNYESSSSSEDETIKHMKSCTTYRRPKRRVYWMSDSEAQYEWEKRPVFPVRSSPVERKCSEDEESSGSEDGGGGGERGRESSSSQDRKRKCTDDESSGNEDEAKRRRT